MLGKVFTIYNPFYYLFKLGRLLVKKFLSFLAAPKLLVLQGMVADALSTELRCFTAAETINDCYEVFAHERVTENRVAILKKALWLLDDDRMVILKRIPKATGSIEELKTELLKKYYDEISANPYNQVSFTQQHHDALLYWSKLFARVGIIIFLAGHLKEISTAERRDLLISAKTILEGKDAPLTMPEKYQNLLIQLNSRIEDALAKKPLSTCLQEELSVDDHGTGVTLNKTALYFAEAQGMLKVFGVEIITDKLRLCEELKAHLEIYAADSTRLSDFLKEWAFDLYAEVNSCLNKLLNSPETSSLAKNHKELYTQEALADLNKFEGVLQSLENPYSVKKSSMPYLAERLEPIKRLFLDHDLKLNEQKKKLIKRAEDLLATSGADTFTDVFTNNERVLATATTTLELVKRLDFAGFPSLKEEAKKILDNQYNYLQGIEPRNASQRVEKTTLSVSYKLTYESLLQIPLPKQHAISSGNLNEQTSGIANNLQAPIIDVESIV